MGETVADICASERFRSYLREFRARHPLDVELAAKYGVLADIEGSDSMTHHTRGTFFGGTA